MVYDKRPVSIDKALNVDHNKIKHIKVDMFGNKKLVLDSIYYKNGGLYGFLSKSTKKNLIELKIDEDKIIQIRLHNKAKSTAGTVFMVLGTIVLLPIILISIVCANGKCSMGWEGI
jgi:hypothetical protein